MKWFTSPGTVPATAAEGSRHGPIGECTAQSNQGEIMELRRWSRFSLPSLLAVVAVMLVPRSSQAQAQTPKFDTFVALDGLPAGCGETTTTCWDFRRNSTC
jgi:hypothetical protein